MKDEPERIGDQFETATTAQEVLAVISQMAVIPMITASLSRALYAAISTRMPMQTRHPSFELVSTGGLNIPEAKAGYYLIVDTTYFNPGDYYHAYNSFFLLNVPQVPYVVPINRKVVKPTVEKEVYDNQDGANEAGFGSSADHAINEEFQFQLTATLPDKPRPCLRLL